MKFNKNIARWAIKIGLFFLKNKFKSKATIIQEVENIVVESLDDETPTENKVRESKEITDEID
jgi:deoxyadenosine/deoxycytidine kinase